MTTDSRPSPEDISVLYVTADSSQADRFSREIREKTEFDVRTEGTVSEGIEALEEGDDVGCIVSDYDLPDVDGLAFLQSVRSMRPDLPFILFTSEGDESVASKAITARVTDYLIKEQFQEQWDELAGLIQHASYYNRSQHTTGDPETRAKVILEASLDPMGIVQDGSFVYANQNALDVFEVDTIDSLADDHIRDVISPDSREMTTAMIEAIQAGETNVDRQKQTILGRAGTRRPIELTAVSITWNGDPAMLFICRDISERQERKAKLRRFKQAVKSAGHAIYITDTDGTIEYVNPEFEAITGYSPEEALGRNPQIMKSGEMSEEYFENLWDTILSGEVWEEALVNRRKDGTLYHAHQTVAPITDGDGEINGFVAIQTDISEQKRLEEQLVEAKERYESLFDSIRDAIFVADTDRRIIDCNPAFTDLFGYELEEVEGELTRYVYENEEEYEEIGHAMEGHFGDPDFTQTATYEKKSGQTFSGETNVSYFRNADGENVGYIGVVRDVTDRTQRLRQIQMVDRILQHNFNNGVNVIEGYAETIDDATTGEIATYAAKILENSQKLRRTITKERAVTEFLSDEPTMTTLDIGSEVETVVEEIQETYSNAEISTDIQRPAAGRAVSEISRAVTELLQNAIIHTDNDRPWIHVEVAREAEHLKISVADNNPHIPEMERKVLVEGEEMAPLYHGSGIGLWLVNLIVSHSDGMMDVALTEPQGNEITIRVPRTE